MRWDDDADDRLWFYMMIESKWWYTVYIVRRTYVLHFFGETKNLVHYTQIVFIEMHWFWRIPEAIRCFAVGCFLLMSLRKPGGSIVIPKPWMNVNSPMFVILRVPNFLNRKQTSSLFLGWDCKISSEMNSLLRVDRAWWWFHSMTNIIPSWEFPPKGTSQDVFPFPKMGYVSSQEGNSCSILNAFLRLSADFSSCSAVRKNHRTLDIHKITGWKQEALHSKSCNLRSVWFFEGYVAERCIFCSMTQSLNNHMALLALSRSTGIMGTGIDPHSGMIWVCFAS